MKRKLISALVCVSMAASAAMFPAISSAAKAPEARQMEYLDRGTVAVKVKSGVFLSWRLLGTENYDTGFDVYRGTTKVNTAPITDSTNYTDKSGTADNKYTVVPAGKSVSEGKAVSVWGDQYTTIDITPPDSYTEDDGTEITYSANDASCGDLDGDGDYEIILKWDPSGSFDSGETKHSGYSGKVYIDAYDIEKNERLWRMDLGKNISAGAHFTQFAVYDFDLDGKAEIAFKTAPGSKDGLGNYVTAASSVAAINNANNKADLRANTGRILQGDEYYTVFDGKTGAALDTIYYPVPRGTIKAWGDSYGGRVDRFLTSVAYLDGVTPSVITWRGYYTRTTAVAYNLVDKRLVEIARFDSDTYSGPNSDMEIAGQGNHNTTVGDIDDDGKEEIICGGLCLGYENDDFVVQWTTETGHGDALHLADYDPTHERMEYFIVHEESPYGMSVVDAASGEIMYHQNGVGDTGRGIMAHFKDNGYYQIWGVGTAYKDEEGFKGQDNSGVLVGNRQPNFRIFWDGDTYDELMDGSGKAEDVNGTELVIASGTENNLNLAYRMGNTINTTKKNPCLQADLFGDWREEVVMRDVDNTKLYIHTTTIETTHKLYTLMHDSGYRMQVAGQNSAYNQPPHISYYLSENGDDDRQTAAYVKTVHDGETTVRTANIPTDKNEYVPPVTEEISATKVRNEIGTEIGTPDSDKVWINSYKDYWGTAYFGFGGLTDFDPEKITSAEIRITTAQINAGTNKNRTFTFELFGTDNSWQAGTYTVTSNPYPSGDAIVSVACQTNNDKGDILVPGKSKSFDITDYIKSFAKGTEEISIIASVPLAGDGSSACSMFLYNEPKLVIKYKPEAAPKPTESPATDKPVEETFEITGVSEETVSYKYVSGKAAEDLTIIAVLYDENGTIIDVKLDNRGKSEANTAVEDSVKLSITPVKGQKIKLLAWDSINSRMIPLANPTKEYEIK